jgi:hypothetical protein
LKTFVNAAVPFEDASKAHAVFETQKLGYGKVVITIPAATNLEGS